MYRIGFKNIHGSIVTFEPFKIGTCDASCEQENKASIVATQSRDLFGVESIQHWSERVMSVRIIPPVALLLQSGAIRHCSPQPLIMPGIIFPMSCQVAANVSSDLESSGVLEHSAQDLTGLELEMHDDLNSWWKCNRASAFTGKLTILWSSLIPITFL